MEIKVVIVMAHLFAADGYFAFMHISSTIIQRHHPQHHPANTLSYQCYWVKIMLLLPWKSSKLLCSFTMSPNTRVALALFNVWAN